MFLVLASKLASKTKCYEGVFSYHIIWVILKIGSDDISDTIKSMRSSLNIALSVSFHAHRTIKVTLPHMYILHALV